MIDRRMLRRVLRHCLDSQDSPVTVFRLLGSEELEDYLGQLSDKDIILCTREYLAAYGEKYLGMIFDKDIHR